MSKVPSRRSELPCLLAGPANYQRRIVRSSPIRRTQLMQFQIGHSTPRCPSATSGTTRVPASTGGPDRCAECSRAADVGLRGAPPVYRPQPLTTQLKRALPAFGQAQLAMGLRLASPVRTSMPPVITSTFPSFVLTGPCHKCHCNGCPAQLLRRLKRTFTRTGESALGAGVATVTSR